MAVYTSLEIEDIQSLVSRFGIGDVIDYSGIAEGMENSNYFVNTSSHHLAIETGEKMGEYVLTLFEELPESHLPFHINVLQHLQHDGVAVAAPLEDYNGDALQQLKGKPAVLCPRLAGQHPNPPSIQQCQAIGDTLADIHTSLGGFENAQQHTGIRDNNWLIHSVAKAKPLLNAEDQKLAQSVLESYQHTLANHDFSKSIIHGDLFHDNCLFEGNSLQGVIDFFNAGYGFCIYDLAIVVNDWCMDADGRIKPEHYQSLIKSYAQKRPFTKSETQYWPQFLQIAALRFWVSRLLSLHSKNKNAHELCDQKDPLQYKRILQNHLQHALPALS